LKDYHRTRIKAWLYPEDHKLEASWQVEQSLTAIGSGGPTGQGMFKGRLKELEYVPERRTDFIFSVVGEELGFRGTLLYLALLSLFIFRILWTGVKCQNPFGRLLCVGFACMFAFHGWVNVAMTIGLAPVTGLPLPFMSYATNFLVVSFIAVAIIQSVHRFPSEDMLFEMRRTLRKEDGF
jgi:rod shape determining protein RodA